MQATPYPLVPPEIDPEFGSWLAGFIDGEGSFLLRYHRTPADQHRISLRFQLEIRADELPIIQEIVATVGFGLVTLRPGMPRLSDGPGSTAVEYRCKPICGWRVDGKANIARLVGLLDRFPLRAKKAQDYAIWREAAMYWFTVRKQGNQYAPRLNDMRPLIEARERLDAIRVYRDPELPADGSLDGRLGSYGSRQNRAG